MSANFSCRRWLCCCLVCLSWGMAWLKLQHAAEPVSSIWKNSTTLCCSDVMIVLQGVRKYSIYRHIHLIIIVFCHSAFFVAHNTLLWNVEWALTLRFTSLAFYFCRTGTICWDLITTVRWLSSLSVVQWVPMTTTTLSPQTQYVTHTEWIHTVLFDLVCFLCRFELVHCWLMSHLCICLISFSMKIRPCWCVTLADVSVI